MSVLAPSGPSMQEAPPAAQVRVAPFIVPTWYGALLVGALLLANQPYRGVRHDAVLYLGQALIRLDPSWWRSDVYFAFGSQDQYSVFSRLFALPVRAFGIPVAEMAALTIGRLATFCALYLLVDRWLPLRRWLALACVAGVVHYYGGKTFSAIEPFVTARTFAEPLSLFAIGAVLRGRWTLGALSLAAAFIVHPLIALPTALILWVYLVVAEGRRWIGVGAVVAALVLALGAAGVTPFDGLLRRYDNDWFTMAGFLTSTAFVSEWSARAYVAILGYAVIVWAATWHRRDPLARLSRIAVVLGPLCCAASFWIADWEHNRLLTQLQFWRTIWIGEVLSALWLPNLVLDQWARGAVGRVAAAAVCAGWIVVQDDLGLYGWAVLLWIALWLMLSLRDAVIERRVLRLAFAATVLAGLMAVGQHCWDALYQLRADMRGFALTYPASIPFRVPMLTVSTIGLLLVAWQTPRWRPACAAAAIALAVISIWQTDQRDEFTRFVESATPAQRPFQSDIPPTARVYWDDDEVAPVWLLLHRAAFGEPAQFSGALFTRQVALTGRDIWSFLDYNSQRLGHCAELQSWTSRDYVFQDCIVPLDRMRTFCAGSLHPDFIVSKILYPLPQRSQWTFRSPDGGEPVNYYLYACSAIRAAAPPPAAFSASPPRPKAIP